MTTQFRADAGLIIVRAHLRGPGSETVAQLALDTGATSTVVSTQILVAIGYDPAAVPTRSLMTTGSGLERVARITVEHIRALGRERKAFPVVGHTLPPTTSVDGLLGLDFLRNTRLTIGFRNGLVSFA